MKCHKHTQVSCPVGSLCGQWKKLSRVVVYSDMANGGKDGECQPPYIAEYNLLLGVHAAPNPPSWHYCQEMLKLLAYCLQQNKDTHVSACGKKTREHTRLQSSAQIHLHLATTGREATCWFPGNFKEGGWELPTILLSHSKDSRSILGVQVKVIKLARMILEKATCGDGSFLGKYGK